jgi:hypothetical protein
MSSLKIQADHFILCVSVPPCEVLLCLPLRLCMNSFNTISRMYYSSPVISKEKVLS